MYLQVLGANNTFRLPAVLGNRIDKNINSFFKFTVPPKIMEDMTSNDVVVREMTDVTLHCRAVGYPEPYVMWRRGDGYDFIYNGEKGEKMIF